MAATASSRRRIRASHAERGAQLRELYFFTLYRCLLASIIAFLALSPFASPVAELAHPLLARLSASLYIFGAGVLLLSARHSAWPLAPQVIVGTLADIAAVLLAKWSLNGPETGIALLLLVNIGAAALLLPMRWGMGFAILAALGSLGEYLLGASTNPQAWPDISETVMFAVTYLSAAVLSYVLGQQLRASEALAAERGQQVSDLAQINELIIRRLHSGVVVVDSGNLVRMANEAAWHLLGGQGSQGQALAQLSPPLQERLARWRQRPGSEPKALSLGRERPTVVPRFSALGGSDGLTLIFLDDSSLVSRRAQELTLSALGRLSASIAHEIRNPLGAISHATQLLQESDAIGDTDRRLLDIILTHGQRMNGIVENVLGLARRERSRPERLDLAEWTRITVNDYLHAHPLEGNQLRAQTPGQPLWTMVDPKQLHQVVIALIGNALDYGHDPNLPAQITVRACVSETTGAPLLEVLDRGPGIADEHILSIFEPFFTTSELGSGLGLYIAKQLCEANQASLSYSRSDEGGSCFRIALPRTASLAPTAS